MNKQIIWLALAGIVIAAGGICLKVAQDRTHSTWHGEADADEGHSPSDGDYWAIRLGYGGDPQRLRFEPAWLLESAKQDQKIQSASPAGVRTYRHSATAALALDANAFTLLGPKPLAGEGFGSSNNAGRVNAILTDPDHPAVAWLGADGGGVWKTINCCTVGTTWTIKTDFPEIASMAIGDLTMDPNNHDVIYAGTGDLRYGSMSFGAAGVLKSRDRGETWQLLGTNVFNPIYGPVLGFPQYQAIGKVVVDPNNSNNVIVGTKTGVYFSYDAGANWAGPCYTNNFASGVGAQRQDTTGLLAVKRSTATYLYVGVGTRGTATPVQPDLGNNGANGVYRTTMPASGCPAVASWALLTNGFPAGTGSGTANMSRGRLELAVAPSDPSTLYAMFSNVATKGILGVWKTTNGGDNWTQVGTPANAGTQMWYDAGLTVSPTNSNELFVSAVDLYRSSNGGTSYVNLTNAYNGGPVHPDNHARAFVGGDASKVLNGNDGGVYYASNALAANTPAAANWMGLNDSLSTIEIYHGDITANFATSNNAGATGGFQDNGSASIVFNGTPSAGAWTATNGGDGIVSRIEPVLGQSWYTSIYNAAIYASTTGAFGTQTDISPPLDSSDRASFFTPFDLYRNGTIDAPGSGCTSAAGCTHIILGTQRVWESTDGGFISWSSKTGDLSKNNLIVGIDNRSYINQIHYSVSDPTIAMAATNDGNVQYVFGLGTADAATAVNVTGNNVFLPNRPMQDVTTDPLNPLLGYAAVGGFSANTPTTPGHLFQVTCGAMCASFTWADKSGNLPDIPANAVIVNPRNPKQVFVGMDWGLYYTDDISVATPVWQRFEGLPHVMVWSLSIDRGFTTLAAFTRSRGAWVWPLPAAALGSADIEVTVTPPAIAEPGRSIAYTVMVKNHGPDTANDVQVTSQTPPGLTFAANTGNCIGAYPCMLPSLVSGATQMISTRLCVPRNYAGPNPIALSASASSAAFDPVSSNNGMTVPVAVLVDSVFVDGFEACP